MEKQEEEALIKRILRKTRLFSDGKPKAVTAEEAARDAAELKKAQDALATQKAERDRISWEKHESLLTKPRDIMGRDEYHPGYSGPAHVRDRLEASYSIKRKDGLFSGIGIDTADTVISSASIGAGMITSGLSGMVGISISPDGEAELLKVRKNSEAKDKAAAAAIIAREKQRAEKEDVLEDRFADVILAELSKFGPDTGEDVNVTAVFGRVLTSMKEFAALSGTSLEAILESFDMTEEKSPKIVALEELAAQMTSYWQDPEFALEPQHFDLNTPKSLTVWKGDKGAYSKHSHIGGESFVPTKAHVGKRGHIILTFNAVTPEPYSWMEMPLTDSLVDLSRFQSHFVNAGFVTKWSEIANAEQAARQAAELAKHGDKYADFGSY